MPSNDNRQDASTHLPAEVLAKTANLTDVEVAKLLNCSTSALRNARAYNKGVLKNLPYHKFGHSIRYSLRDVLDFQQTCRVDPQERQFSGKYPANILSYEDLGNAIQCSIAAFRVNYPKPFDATHIGQYEGQLAFVCPFCLTVHFHTIHRPGFGECNDHWPSQCLHKNCLNKQGYILVEARDPEDAGDLPKKLVNAALKHLSRQRLAELRKG